MDLLERYLQAVGEYLPARTRADTLAELRENLLAEMECREEEMGRSLTQGEVADVLEKHGRPVLVAARYLPQHHLIGPAWFPIYWFTLKRSFPFVVLVYVVTNVVAWLFQGGRGVDVGAAVGHFPSVALTFWAVVTLGFASFEYAQGRYFHQVDLSKGWNPNDLPKVEPAQGKRPSLAGGVADVIVSAVGMAWLLAIPYKPYLILGPLVGHLREMPFGLTPEWHIFYWQIICLLGVQLVLKTMMVFLHGVEGWRKGFDMVVQVIGILIIAVMVQARTYMVPGTSVGAMSMKDLTTLNTAINFGFKVALALSVVKLLWDIWKMVVSSRSGQKRFVTVL
jgi:hypothetical protein